MQSLSMEISNRTILRFLALTTLFIAAVTLAIRVRAQLILIATAFFLAIAMNPLVERFMKITFKHKRGPAAVLAFLIVILIIILISAFIMPTVISQSQSLIRDLPGWIGRLEVSNNWLGRELSQLDLAATLHNNQTHFLTQLLQSHGGSIYKLLQSIFHSVVGTLTLMTLTVFMMIEGPSWLGRFMSIQPPHRREHIQELARAMYQVVNRYVTVNLALALLLGLVTFGALLVLGIPFAAPLSFVAGFFSLIPLVGGIIGSSIVVLICLFSSTLAAVVMAGFYIVYHQVEGNLVRPLVIGKTIDLSPLVVLIAVILGVAVEGVLGALLAIPIAGCLQILLKDYLRKPVKA